MEILHSRKDEELFRTRADVNGPDAQGPKKGPRPSLTIKSEDQTYHPTGLTETEDSVGGIGITAESGSEWGAGARVSGRLLANARVIRLVVGDIRGPPSGMPAKSFC